MDARKATAFVALVLALAMPFVALDEGQKLSAYADPVGIYTICKGHTGGDIKPGLTVTPDKCDAWFTSDMAKAYEDVTYCIRVELTTYQAAALTSFTFNVGKGALCNSTLARLANTGAPANVWCRQLDRWTYASKYGVTLQLPGLVKRRAAERELCLGHLPPPAPVQLSAPQAKP